VDDAVFADRRALAVTSLWRAGLCSLLLLMAAPLAWLVSEKAAASVLWSGSAVLQRQKDWSQQSSCEVMAFVGTGHLEHLMLPELLGHLMASQGHPLSLPERFVYVKRELANSVKKFSNAWLWRLTSGMPWTFRM